MKIGFGALIVLLLVACGSKARQNKPDCAGLKKVPKQGCLHEAIESPIEKPTQEPAPKSW